MDTSLLLGVTGFLSENITTGAGRCAYFFQELVKGMDIVPGLLFMLHFQV